jgi:hypothetical protein
MLVTYPSMARQSVKNRRGACGPMKKAFRGAHPPIINAKNCTAALFGVVIKVLDILDSQRSILLIA